jgi:hypothetical protein
LGLDRNRDGELSWGEIRDRHADIAAYVLQHLRLYAASGPCALDPGPQSLVDLSAGTYTELPLRMACDGRSPVRLEYDLLFEFDPTHRGVLRLITAQGERTFVLSADRKQVRLNGWDPGGVGRTLTEFIGEGIWHIWIGLDHVLFLLTLLLPAVLERRAGVWQSARSLRRVGGEVLSIVTAFTVAHSITLALTVLGRLDLPGVWVESAIAASIALAAFNNLHPFLPGRGWMIAFVLGLVHGMGFASVLIDLGLPNGALLWPLLGFNLGVEIGQLAIVALFVPIAYLLRDTAVYRLAGLRFGSMAAVGIALIWVAERSLGQVWLPS